MREPSLYVKIYRRQILTYKDGPGTHRVKCVVKSLCMHLLKRASLSLMLDCKDRLSEVDPRCLNIKMFGLQLNRYK